MTAKNVWGVIMIVLGIFMIINGATKCHEADFCGNEIQLLDRQLSKYVGDEIFNAKRYVEIFKQEKTYGIIGAFMGIAMAIGGTYLLRGKKDSISVLPEDDFEDDLQDNPDRNDGEWRF